MQFELQDFTCQTTESITGSGGFLYIKEAIYSNITNLQLYDSYSAQSGSQIYTQKQGLQFMLSNSGFYQILNKALDQYPYDSQIKNYGGITLLNTISTTLNQNQFEGNSISKTGGAIYVYGGYLSIFGCSFQDMYAFYGAAMFLDSIQDVVIEGQVIQTSLAKYQGGGMFIKNPKGDIQILDSVFNKVVAENEGGCVYYLVEDQSDTQVLDFFGIQITIIGPLKTLEFRNVNITKVKAINASSVLVSSLRTNVYFSSCQLIQSYGQAINSIFIKLANMVEINNFNVASLYSRSHSSFLYVDNSETVFIPISDSKIGPSFDFEAIGYLFYSDRDIMTPIIVKSAKQFFIENMFMMCQMERLTTPRTQALIIFQPQLHNEWSGAQYAIFADINSFYKNCEGLNGGIYSLQYHKAYLFNNTVIGLVSMGGDQPNGGIFSLLGDDFYFNDYRSVTIRNSTFENIEMIVGTGGFIYQNDKNLLFIKVESVTVRKVRADYHAVFNMLGLFIGSLYIYSLPEFQRTEFSDFFAKGSTQLLYIQGNIRSGYNNVKIKDTTVDCQNKDITILMGPPNFSEYDEGVIRYEGAAGLQTENCIFRNCRQSYQGAFIKIGSYKYKDKGSQFYNLTGTYGSIVSCTGCNLIMQDTIIHDSYSTQSGGALYFTYNSKAKMYGGFLFNEQQSYFDFSVITIQNSKAISNIQSQQGGFAYINNPQTDITLLNVELSNITSIDQGGIFYVDLPQFAIKIIIKILKLSNYLVGSIKVQIKGSFSCKMLQALL
ncbi:UNKNOWN [Stylonychia lemnae]|uniref:Pectin lyase fold/virulence factor n=1 Tax=Stylonychia lemnae TaxID=5949 RepID=A0A078B5X5_STYLE|nr:UNKNOWN [Stylonychia lemnae]|eukprot:CDW88888.1 UNKNOWN [Stylonychia lemnae]